MVNWLGYFTEPIVDGSLVRVSKALEIQIQEVYRLLKNGTMAHVVVDAENVERSVALF